MRIIAASFPRLPVTMSVDRPEKLCAHPEETAVLETDWWELWKQTGMPSPFSSPAWTSAWRRWLGRGEAITLVARGAGRAAGILPLERRRGRLTAAGTGVSDVLLPVLDPLAAAPALDALVEAAAALLRPGQVLDLQQWPADAPRPVTPPGFRSLALFQDRCPRLELRNPDAVPRGQARRAAYALRRLERMGATVRLVGKPAELPAAMEALFELHRRRWRVRGLPGVFAREEVRCLHCEFSREMLERALLRLWMLELDGRAVACVYGWSAGGALWHYGGGFEPDLARLGPGTALLGAAIREARAEGLRRWEFLRGAEPYKERWGASPRVNRRFLIMRADPISYAAGARLRLAHTLATVARDAWVRYRFR